MLEAEFTLKPKQTNKEMDHIRSNSGRILKHYMLMFMPKSVYINHFSLIENGLISLSF